MQALAVGHLTSALEREGLLAVPVLPAFRGLGLAGHDGEREGLRAAGVIEDAVAVHVLALSNVGDQRHAPQRLPGGQLRPGEDTVLAVTGELIGHLPRPRAADQGVQVDALALDELYVLLDVRDAGGDLPLVPGHVALLHGIIRVGGTHPGEGDLLPRPGVRGVIGGLGAGHGEGAVQTGCGDLRLGVCRSVEALIAFPDRDLLGQDQPRVDGKMDRFAAEISPCSRNGHSGLPGVGVVGIRDGVIRVGDHGTVQSHRWHRLLGRLVIAVKPLVQVDLRLGQIPLLCRRRPG